LIAEAFDPSILIDNLLEIGVPVPLRKFIENLICIISTSLLDNYLALTMLLRGFHRVHTYDF